MAVHEKGGKGKGGGRNEEMRREGSKGEDNK